jgi:ABC-type multidrug transport system fused ATPase/permease subunit
VLAGGRIVEDGAPADLLGRGGAFTELFTSGTRASS